MSIVFNNTYLKQQLLPKYTEPEKFTSSDTDKLVLK